MREQLNSYTPWKNSSLTALFCRFSCVLFNYTFFKWRQINCSLFRWGGPPLLLLVIRTKLAGAQLWPVLTSVFQRHGEAEVVSAGRSVQEGLRSGRPAPAAPRATGRRQCCHHWSARSYDQIRRRRTGSQQLWWHPAQHCRSPDGYFLGGAEVGGSNWLQGEQSVLAL